MNDFAKRLLKWHEKFGRKHLPWQNETDPYRVWISEIMLQQTQVATVIERYQLFLEKFPTVDALAKAAEEEVLALWAGMGYYTRARNLWKCAKKIKDDYGGQFPSDSQELEKLPGIGPSTAAAIAAFCFLERRSILDGNVQRVLARIFGVTQPINQSTVQKKLWGLANSLVPKEKRQMPSYTQALMDFGATACTPKKVLCLNKNHPQQRICVFADVCQAYQSGRVEQIPFKTPKKISPQMTSEVLIIFCQKKIFLEKRPSEGIWGGLWSLPESPWQSHENKNADDAQSFFFTQCKSNLDSSQSSEWQKAYKNSTGLAPIKHVFTHRTLFYTPRVMKLTKELRLNASSAWFTKEELTQLGLPTPIKKLLDSFESFS